MAEKQQRLRIYRYRTESEMFHWFNIVSHKEGVIEATDPIAALRKIVKSYDLEENHDLKLESAVIEGGLISPKQKHWGITNTPEDPLLARYLSSGSATWNSIPHEDRESFRNMGRPEIKMEGPDYFVDGEKVPRKEEVYELL